ncbi:PilZ domain-containing protein [Sphingobium sp.]|uniref:PilZ domain-containing protein n=1 Tax=Sphingobium sp. TaxID=1912891 RepID=UPI002C3D6259|nr:PilZ domain-containing protein [Sphingobium sp.]HUD90614.1 PilZ domain-containing protein [Sphingobium sp.]
MEQLVYRAIAEKRRDRRYHVDIEGRLVGDDGITQTATVRNISIYGAMLAGLTPPPVGSRVILILPYLERDATLIWSQCDQCGLLFGSPVDPVAIVVNAGTSAESLAAIEQRIQ